VPEKTTTRAVARAAARAAATDEQQLRLVSVDEGVDVLADLPALLEDPTLERALLALEHLQQLTDRLADDLLLRNARG